jgi:hypothetical protein
MTRVCVYEGRGVVRQRGRQSSADATIVVGGEAEGGGWEITIHPDPQSQNPFDGSRLVHVSLPTGEAGRFVEWDRRGHDVDPLPKPDRLLLRGELCERDGCPSVVALPRT